MPNKREEFITRIAGERERNFMLPGSENDILKSSNDWIVTAMFYLSQARETGDQLPTQERYEEELVKTAAIILAALEHSDIMREKGRLS